MHLIKHGLLIMSLTLLAACEKAPQTAAEPASPVASNPAPANAPAVATPVQEAAAPASPITETAPPTIPSVEKAMDTPSAAVAACKTGCVLMNCPPPIGPKKCCKLVSGVYQACL